MSTFPLTMLNINMCVNMNEFGYIFSGVNTLDSVLFMFSKFDRCWYIIFISITISSHFLGVSYLFELFIHYEGLQTKTKIHENYF